jgi:hypothetical protein
MKRSMNLEKKKLQHHPGAQCYVEITEGQIDFISYSTLVIRATLAPDLEDGTKWLLSCTGTYSQTTRKQIGYFLKEYFGDIYYSDMKSIAGTNDYILAEHKTAKYW